MIRIRARASVGMALATAVLATAVLGIAAFLPATKLQAQNSPRAGAAALQTTLQMYCVGCHSGPTPFAGLNLEPLDFSNLEQNGAIWEKLIRKLRGRQMP